MFLKNLNIFIFLFFAFAGVASSANGQGDEIKKALERFARYQNKNNKCSVLPTFKVVCSYSILNWADDDRVNQLQDGYTNCTLNIKSKVDYEKLSELQSGFQNRFKERVSGNILESINSCISRNQVDSKESRHLIAKSAYALDRFEKAEIELHKQLSFIDQYLGVDKNNDCRNSIFLEARKACDFYKNKCSFELDHEKKQEALEKLTEKCEVDARKYSQGLKSASKETQSQIAAALQVVRETCPWIFQEEYIKSRDLRADFQPKYSAPHSIKDSLKKQFESNRAQMKKSLFEIKDAAKCFEAGSVNSDVCKPERLNEILQKTPDAESYSKAKDQSKWSLNMAAERCVADISYSRDEFKNIIKKEVTAAVFSLITVGAGAVVTTATRLATASNTAKVAGAIAGTTTAAIDVAFLAQAGKDAHEACSDRQVQKISSSEMACPLVKKHKDVSWVAEGDCKLNIALALAQGVPVIAAAAKAVSMVSRELKATQAVPAKLKRREKELPQTDKRHQQKERFVSGIEGKIEGEIKPPTIAHLPADVKILKVKNSEDKTLHYVQYSEKVGDEWVKVSREIQFDPLTGAIDGNFSGGKELFEKLAQASAGKAYFSFGDVGMLGYVNKNFIAGTEAGDQYIQAVAKSILKKGEGKITLCRLGGDEFGMIIHEKDPAKVKKLLDEIQKDLRKLGGEGHEVFLEQKKLLAKKHRDLRSEYKSHPSEENLIKIKESESAIKELGKSQQPTLSIGTTEIGFKDDLGLLLGRAEDQAKEAKIQYALKNARSAKKYGVDDLPSERPDPKYIAEIKEPTLSPSLKGTQGQLFNETKPLPDGLRDMVWQRDEEVSRVGLSSLTKYKNELGEEVVRLEKYNNSRELVTSYEIPKRGSSGLLDGLHEQSQKLITEHFSSKSDNVIMELKLSSLKYLNYFESGTKAGDISLKAFGDAIKKEFRNSDLVFKGGGADFFVSVDQMSYEARKKIQARVLETFKKDPQVLKVLDDERRVLEQKLIDARRNGDTEKVNKYQQQLSDLKNFEMETEIQELTQKEAGSSSFKEIQEKLDEKFERDRAAAAAVEKQN